MSPPRSVPIVAALMLLGVAIVLGGALLFVRRESAALGIDASVTRTPLVVEATPTPRPAVAASNPTPTTHAAVATAPLPSPTSVPLPTVTRMPTAEPASGATPRGTVVLDVRVFRVNGTPVVILPGTPTPEIPWWQRMDDTPEPLVRDLMTGYLHFWDVRAQVLGSLETAPLNAVMAAGPLQDELAFIQQMRTRDQAEHVDVDHSITVRWATAEQGAVIDRLTDRSTIIELNATPEATPTPQSSTYTMAFLLQRTPGAWQVIDSIRIVR